jgi:Mg2+ and Co2+ transporter CorA
MDNAENRVDHAPDRKTGLREIVYLLFPDVLMIVLAIVMIPIILIPLFVDLPDSITGAFEFMDYAILIIFILEYLLKTVLAPNILKHVINPWHLLDLFVIIVPLVSLLPVVSFSFGHTSLLLRLLRIIRIVAMGGRAVDRRIKSRSINSQTEESELKPMEIQVMDGTLGNAYQNVPFEKLSEYITKPSQTWVNISWVSDDDFERLSSALGISRILLESELTEDSYPRVDYFEQYSLIFARIGDIQISHKGTEWLTVDRKGLLVICHGQNIITVTKTKNDLFSQLIEKSKKALSPGEPLVVTILYTILKYILEKDKQIIVALEQELMILENIPLGKRPNNFLEITFYLRKEVNQIVPSLLHLREIISVITSKRVPLEGFSESHEKIFDILLDEATYLHETASNARDNLQSLVDLYINTTSYETNKVMRTIAVITCLGIIPAAMGLLGSNIVGNPWNIQLWQVFGLLGILMLVMGWVFYRLGWLKG